MKLKHSLIVLLFISSFSFSQTRSKRYYPSLKNILLTEEETIPLELTNLKEWLKSIAKELYYSDLQHNISPRNDASFNSLRLIPRHKQTFSIGNSGVQIILNDKKEDKESFIPILYNDTFKIFAYTPNFDIKSFKINDYQKLFELGLIINKISDTQTLANFINTFTNVKRGESLTALNKFLIDLENSQNLTFENKSDTKTTLLDVSKSIYRQTNYYSYLAPYKTYVANESDEITRKKYS